VGDRVSRMVLRHIGELEGKVEKRASKPVTFSMRLSAREHAKLVWLAENLDVPKTPFAEELLKAALDESIERYAAWASLEDPEGFVARALEGIEDKRKRLESPAKRRRAPGPRPPKP
jgi:hypothetical protein